jgi:hypothetical protein
MMRPGTAREQGVLGAMRLVDLLCAAYMAAVAGLIALGRARVDPWPALLAGHIAFVAVAVALPTLALRAPRARFLDLLRIYYPVLVFAWAYLEMDFLQPILTGGWTASLPLAELDRAIFGTHLTVAVERLYGSPLDELFALLYLSYYAVPAVIGVLLLHRGRRDELLTVVGAVALTYVVNFILFLLIPALGPRSTPGLADLHHAHYHGPLFARLCLFAEGDAGPIAGAVFPSSHVSATLAWGLATYRYSRPLGRLATALALAIAPATVYLGYHAAIDSVAGALLPLVTVPAAFALMRRRGEVDSAPPAAPRPDPRPASAGAAT